MFQFLFYVSVYVYLILSCEQIFFSISVREDLRSAETRFIHRSVRSASLIYFISGCDTVIEDF
jgi:hypothetical protein